VADARGESVLHYAWDDVTNSPCAVAKQVADVLTRRGWNRSSASLPPLGLQDPGQLSTRECASRPGSSAVRCAAVSAARRVRPPGVIHAARRIRI
jgi:hypothetical protein